MTTEERQDIGASANADQALVSDQAELHRLDPAGFDPSRWPSMDTAPRDASIFLARGLNHGIGPGEHYVYAQWADCAFVDANDCATELLYLTAWFDASAIEAGTAETVKLGSVHDGPVPQADAQTGGPQ